jgi:hypothetical protein
VRSWAFLKAISASIRHAFNIAPTQPYFVLKTTYESREAIPAKAR